MNKITTLVAAGALALVVGLATTAPSSADPAGAAIAGGMLGFMAGTALGSGTTVYYDYPPPPHYWRPGSWRDHVAACEDDYGWHYSPRSDLVHLHGDVFPCDD